MSAKQQFCAASVLVRAVAVAFSCALTSACASHAPAASAAQPGAKQPTSATPSVAATPRPAYAESDAAYYRARAAALATEAMDEVARTDFWRLRRGRLYVPDASNILELEERLADASRSESAAGVIDASAAILASDQADINAHALRAAALRKTDHTTEADFHRAVVLGLITSITRTGAGRSAESPWIVYREKEEYAVLNEMRARFVSQSVVNIGSRSFDVLDAERDGASLRFYFDINESLAEKARARH